MGSGGQRAEDCLCSEALALFAARLGDTPTEGWLSIRVFGSTHKPLTSEPDWTARQPGFSEEDPAQTGPTHEGSGRFSQWWLLKTTGN